MIKCFVSSQVTSVALLKEAPEHTTKTTANSRLPTCKRVPSWGQNNQKSVSLYSNGAEYKMNRSATDVKQRPRKPSVFEDDLTKIIGINWEPGMPQGRSMRGNICGFITKNADKL